MNQYIKMSIEESIEAKERVINDEKFINVLKEIVSVCIRAFAQGKKMLVFGNGGSASDALHMVAELMGRYEMEEEGYPAYVLNANEATMTALSNDYGFDFIYQKQVKNLAQEGDILFGISTSGNSSNVVKALKCGREKGAICIGLSGKQIGDMDMYCDYILKAPSARTATVQELHIMIIHIICALIKKGQKVR